MPSISVVIPTYKRGPLLKSAILSALQQSLPASEIIVVDDNIEEKESRSVLDCIQSIDEPRIKLISNFRHKGGCGARNSGILTATGEYIAFLDDDDLLLPRALEAHYNAFKDDTAMVYGNCQVVDELYHITETTSFGSDDLHFNDLIMGVCPPSSSVVMVTRTALVEAGLFDESLPSFQDYDMWLKIAQQHSIRSHEGLVAKFIQHDGQRTSINFEKRRSGLELIVKKWNREIQSVRPLKTFINHFMAGAYFSSGTVSLALGAEHRMQAIRFFIKALRLKFFYRRYWKWTLFSLLGFEMTKKIRSIHP